MIKVYVTSMPKTQEECPFYGMQNQKCRITDEKCCLAKKHPDCEHLATFWIENGEVSDGLVDKESKE